MVEGLCTVFGALSGTIIYNRRLVWSIVRRDWLHWSKIKKSVGTFYSQL